MYLRINYQRAAELENVGLCTFAASKGKELSLPDEEYRFAIYGKSPQDTADREFAGKIALAIIRNLGKEE